jgi:hypothetical protein
MRTSTDQISELNSYSKATKWHSDTYPWRITLAQTRKSPTVLAERMWRALDKHGRANQPKGDVGEERSAGGARDRNSMQVARVN